MNRILTSIDRHGADIEFPSHQGEYGTCDFMTPTCSKACKQIVNKLNINCLTFFKTHTTEQILAKILEDMDELEANHLIWFILSGDCPKNMTEKISCIVKEISKRNILQNGFTRNTEFWKIIKDLDNVRFVLTEENEEKANRISKDGLVGVPEYSTDRVKIINEGKVFLCGGGWITCGQGVAEQEDYIAEEDCSLCYKNKQGCWN